MNKILPRFLWYFSGIGVEPVVISDDMLKISLRQVLSANVDCGPKRYFVLVFAVDGYVFNVEQDPTSFVVVKLLVVVVIKLKLK